MNSTSLVSAIIIFLNGEAYIEEAIESILSQTYDHWELLLVDDGSTDGSTTIAKKYAQQYPHKVRYLEHEGHENCGMSATRNLGIKHAMGEYVAFLDADDVWLPHKLERQLAVFEVYPEVGMVVSHTQYWYSWTGNPSDTDRDCLRTIGVPGNTSYQPPVLLSRLLRNEANAPATCGVLIRRKIFEEVGYFESSFRGLFEDRVFFSKVYLKTSVFVMDEYLDRYRQHPDSTCHLEQQSGRYNPYNLSKPHFLFLQWIKSYLLQQNVQDQDVWRSLRIGLLPYQNLPLHYLHQIVRRVSALRRPLHQSSF